MPDEATRVDAISATEILSQLRELAASMQQTVRGASVPLKESSVNPSLLSTKGSSKEGRADDKGSDLSKVGSQSHQSFLTEVDRVANNLLEARSKILGSRSKPRDDGPATLASPAAAGTATDQAKSTLRNGPMSKASHVDAHASDPSVSKQPRGTAAVTEEAAAAPTDTLPEPMPVRATTLDADATGDSETPVRDFDFHDCTLMESEVADAGRPTLQDVDLSHKYERDERVATDSFGEETADSDDSQSNVYDGVKTTVVSQRDDQVLYSMLYTMGRWGIEEDSVHNEKLALLRQDILADLEQAQERELALCSAEVQEATEEDGESAAPTYEEVAARPGGSLEIQKKLEAASKERMIMPSFPLGGGVSESSHDQLWKLYSELVRHLGAHLRRAGSTEQADNASPAPKGDDVGATESNATLPYISKEDLDQRAHEEATECLTIASLDMEKIKAMAVATAGCEPATEAAPLGPPREFIVSGNPLLPPLAVTVDRDIAFDAVAAKVQRRAQLQAEHRRNKTNPHVLTTFPLQVIMNPYRTGFEEAREVPLTMGSVIAGRYQLLDVLGQATFSRAVRCIDLMQRYVQGPDGAWCVDQLELPDSPLPIGASACVEGDETAAPLNPLDPECYVQMCLKVINNSKEFFDQSLDEIRLLHLLNSRGDPDELNFVRMYNFFYHREHTFIVTELLSDNLYEYGKYIRESGEPSYFTVSRVRRISKQILTALNFVHDLNLIHSDLKPENILFVSHRRCLVKVIDFGSSCFTSDHLSSYVQSRSYRAPEVILGADYDGRIDVWSLGAILVELVTQQVLFQSESAAEMLARIVAVCGRSLPRSMLYEGRTTSNFVNRFGCICDNVERRCGDVSEWCFNLYTPAHGYGENETEESGEEEADEATNQPIKFKKECEPFALLKMKLLAEGVPPDSLFVDFVMQCLTLDHKRRPTSRELLQHPFLAEEDEE